MKSKMFKFGLPLAVCMLAIAFAFATQNSTSLEEDAFVPGYVYDNASHSCVPATKDCSTEIGIPCLQDGRIIYQDPTVVGTMCTAELFEYPED